MSKLFCGVLTFMLVGCSQPAADQHSASGSSQNNSAQTSHPDISRQNLEKRDHSGATPLMHATRLNDIETARALIEAGADVNAKDDLHDSPYLYAGARGHLEILNMTLAHGADLKSTNR